jgi:LPXTG-motif cell wall-anchored protein
VDKGLTYTVESYVMAEVSSGSSGYTPVYYSVDADGNKTRIALGETVDGYYYLPENSSISNSGSPSEQGNQGNVLIGYSGCDLIELYPVKENMVIDNVPNDQLTVKKIWAEGTTPEDITVMLNPIIVIDDDIKYLDDRPADMFGGIEWEVTLNEENNWTYQWTGLPATMQVGDVTHELKYCVREKVTVDYAPAYTDGSGAPLQQDAIMYGVSLDPEDADYITVPMRPDDGMVYITNDYKTSDLTINKVWQGVPEEDRKAVTVYLYREQWNQSFKFLQVEAELIATIELSSENNWSVTLKDLPYNIVDDEGVIHYYDYYIVEAGDGDDYTVTYFDDTTGQVLQQSRSTLPEGVDKLYEIDFAVKSTMTYYPSYSITITNAEQYTLPESGGAGTQWYTLGGMATLVTACALLALIRHKQRNRGRGGEC